MIRVLRGQPADVESDRGVTRALAADTRETATPAVRVWTPPRQVAFGRRDARNDGYEAAREASNRHGFPPYVRPVGGRAVAYTGTGVAFARFEPIEDMRVGVDARYEALTADVERALSELGVEPWRGEPRHSFCPGDHSLSGDGKLVGLAQRVQKGVAQTAGIVVVTDRAEIAAVLEEVYAALGVPFDPASVGSVASSGGPDDPATVIEAFEDALVGDRERRVEHVG
jgi:octanoyl-[GcvH]:protein N-octanoyltransferase